MSDTEPVPSARPEGPLHPPDAASPWAAERSRYQGSQSPYAPEATSGSTGASAPSPVPSWYHEPSHGQGDQSQPAHKAQQDYPGQRGYPSQQGYPSQRGYPAETAGPTGWAQEPSPWVSSGVPVDTVGRPRRRRGGGGLVALAVVLALLAGLAGGVLGSVLTDRSELGALLGADDDGLPGSDAGDGSASSTSDESGVADPQPQLETGSVAEIAARVLPSVVSIQVATADGTGTGSGFIFDDEGLIVTNNHVIRGGTQGEIVVELADGSQAAAEVVGTEASYDIAVLRIDPADADGDLRALEFGDSDRVVVGEQVVAVGAPLGLDATVTTGIISALNRPVSAGDAETTAFINAIQTDAAINPGNSGGPLVNMRGEVVGVNSAIAQAPGGRVGGSIGLGFSIPSNQAARTAGQLVSDGVATYPVVGVLLDRSYQGEGVRIVSDEDAAASDSEPVVPGGPADAAGLQGGDVILAFEGRPMTESDELVVAIRAREPGDEVTLTVRRDEEVFDVSLVLEAGDQG